MYLLPHSHWSVAGTYVYADPLGLNGACSSPGNYGAGEPCSQYPENNNYRSQDTTLPAFQLSTLAEMYVKYDDSRLSASLGDLWYDSPWAGPSDSRIKAAYFQGLDAKYAFGGHHWSVDAARITEWENRTSSNFNKSNLIVPLAPDGSIAHPTSGFFELGASYANGSQFHASADEYSFYDIASLLWIEAKWSPAKAPLHLYGGIQFGAEHNVGSSLVGTVDSTVFGVQLGAEVARNVALSISFDSLPWRRAEAVLPAGTSCKSHVLSGGGVSFWLPTGGTPNCIPGPGTNATLFYGGFASPYTDSYSTSPLYTTAISQDVVERRSAGNSIRVSATIHTNDRRLRIILARALDDYSNGAGAEATWGTDVDVEYYLSPLNADDFRGWSIRNRWEQRTQTYTQLWGGTPLFVYNRVELEYRF